MNQATSPAPATAAEPAVLDGKDGIYARIGAMVMEQTGKRIGKSGGRKIFDAVTAEVFAEATKTGTIRFNAGFGSMHVRSYKAGSRKLPSGKETTFGVRKKLRYEEGVVVAALVANGGNLAAAFAKTAKPAAPAAAPAA